MKTITTRQAAEQFDEFARQAHAGEKILVTMEGQPWVVLAPPAAVLERPLGEPPMEWPDFPAHWKQHFPEPISGPTATELLAEDKEDRF